jgi:hypothetical protein
LGIESIKQVAAEESAGTGNQDRAQG